MIIKYEPACLQEIRQKIVMAGDVNGGFHIQTFETWMEYVRTFCPKKYRKIIVAELKAADKRRAELNKER